jgi:hypothetical protein
LTFSDSDWTRDPPLRARVPPTQRRVWLLATAIAVSCVTIALAYYGIEQLIDSAAQNESLRSVNQVITSAPPAAGATAAASAAAASSAPSPAPAASAATDASSAPSPTAVAAAAAAATSAPAAPSAAEVDAHKLAALEAEMRQRAREAAQQAAADAARRKERAWERFYQRPAFCNDNPTGAQMVQCANQYIRARRDFEERYAAGRL